MSKNETILGVVALIIVGVLSLSGIYKSYKTDVNAINAGLEQCQIDNGTRATMWVKECTEHLKIVKN